MNTCFRLFFTEVDFYCVHICKQTVFAFWAAAEYLWRTYRQSPLSYLVNCFHWLCINLTVSLGQNSGAALCPIVATLMKPITNQPTMINSID